MADNIAITQGAGTTVATDDIGGVHYQRVKPTLGADGTAVDVSAGAGAVGTGVQRMTLASDDPAVALLGTMDTDTGNLPTILTALQRFSLSVEYETVAASQTTQTLGATGGTGDYLAGVLVIPATTAAGAVAIKDGANAAITIFTGGTGSVASLVPFMVPLGLVSVAGAWQVTTGANVSAIGVGNFT